MTRDEQILAALDTAELLRGQVLDVEQLAGRIDGARMHMAAGVDELRGQLTVIKERCVWLVIQLDILRAQVLVLKSP